MILQEKSANKHERRLTPYDLSVLKIVSQQRAISLDHLSRFIALLEVKSDHEERSPLKSATHNLVERLQHAGLIHLQKGGRSQPDWIWLTKRGLQTVGISSSWKRPSRTQLPLLHAINTIRLLLTEGDPHISWISQQQLRSGEMTQPIYPLPTAELLTSTGERIALHVIFRLTGKEENLITHMHQQLEHKTLQGEPYYTALRYYATTDAAKRLRAARATIAQFSPETIVRNISIFSYPPVHKHVLYRGHSTSVRTLAWSGDGTRLASASKDSVHVWDASTGKDLFCPVIETTPSMIGWSLDGSWLALGDERGWLSFWEGATGKVHSIAMHHSGRIAGFAWSPLDNDLIASCDTFGRLQMYNVRRHIIHWVSRYMHKAEALAWSPDGLRLSVGGNDSCVRFFHATTGKHLQTYKKHRTAVHALTWSPDGQLLASAGEDPIILIWDAASGKKYRTIRSNLSTIETLAWSPDGMQLACAGSDSCVQVWNVHTGRLLQTYTDHADTITCVVWSPDSTMLASASDDGTVHVYPAIGRLS